MCSSKTRKNLSATIGSFKCEEQDTAKSVNENNIIAAYFEKQVFHMLEMLLIKTLNLTTLAKK